MIGLLRRRIRFMVLGAVLGGNRNRWMMYLGGVGRAREVPPVPAGYAGGDLPRAVGAGAARERAGDQAAADAGSSTRRLRKAVEADAPRGARRLSGPGSGGADGGERGSARPPRRGRRCCSSTPSGAATWSRWRRAASSTATRGIVRHDELIGRSEGRTVRSTRGGAFQVVRPTLTDVVLHMPRGAQVIYPKDLGPLLAAVRRVPRRPGAGVGRRLGRPVDDAAAGRGRRGRLRDAGRLRRPGAQERRRLPRRGGARALPGRGAGLLRGHRRAATSTGSCSTCPSPGRSCPTPRPRCGPAGSSSPTRRDRPGRAVPGGARRPRLRAGETLEVLQRTWHIEGPSVRPDHRMVAHTGFLSHAPAAGGPTRRRRPRPATVPARPDRPSSRRGQRLTVRRGRRRRSARPAPYRLTGGEPARRLILVLGRRSGDRRLPPGLPGPRLVVAGHGPRACSRPPASPPPSSTGSAAADARQPAACGGRPCCWPARWSASSSAWRPAPACASPSPAPRARRSTGPSAPPPGRAGWSWPCGCCSRSPPARSATGRPARPRRSAIAGLVDDELPEPPDTLAGLAALIGPARWDDLLDRPRARHWRCRPRRTRRPSATSVAAPVERSVLRIEGEACGITVQGQRASCVAPGPGAHERPRRRGRRAPTVVGQAADGGGTLQRARRVVHFDSRRRPGRARPCPRASASIRWCSCSGGRRASGGVFGYPRGGHTIEVSPYTVAHADGSRCPTSTAPANGGAQRSYFLAANLAAGRLRRAARSTGRARSPAWRSPSPPTGAGLAFAASASEVRKALAATERQPGRRSRPHRGHGRLPRAGAPGHRAGRAPAERR